MSLPPHVKARSAKYPTGIERTPVADDKVSWSTPWAEYAPVDYTAPVVLKKPVWADVDRSDAELAKAKWNQIDGSIDRRSFSGTYAVVGGVPQNPCGRTGMKGRGLLGRWGPNHAADPIVTRWQRSEKGDVVEKNGKPVLEFVAIKRTDGGGWAIPGGMVEPGDSVSATLKKEFGEEAMNSLEADESKRAEIGAQLERAFADTQHTVYKGYVDDPRNTDESWMETVAVHFHDETNTSFGRFVLCAGDDASAVRWMAVTADLQLYASHRDFVLRAAHRVNANVD